MRRLVLGFGAVGLAALWAVSGCGGASRPKPGDTVTPRFSPAPRWMAGGYGQLNVRLTAHADDAAAERDLDFFTGAAVNPVAAVTFFADDQPLGSVEVPLSHRC